VGGMTIDGKMLKTATIVLARALEKGTQAEVNVAAAMLRAFLPGDDLYFVIQRAAESYAKQWAEKKDRV
jgi:invasion protein IalB